MTEQPVASTPSTRRLDEDEIATLYANLRAYTQHEDTLIGQRFTWLITAQGFLFAGYGLDIQKLSAGFGFDQVREPRLVFDLTGSETLFVIFGILIILISIVFNWQVGSLIKSANMTLVGLDKIWGAQHDLFFGSSPTNVLPHRPTNREFRYLAPILGIYPYVQGCGFRTYEAAASATVPLASTGEGGTADHEPAGSPRLEKKAHASLPNTFIAIWSGILLLHVGIVFYLSYINSPHGHAAPTSPSTCTASWMPRTLSLV